MLGFLLFAVCMVAGAVLWFFAVAPRIVYEDQGRLRSDPGYGADRPGWGVGKAILGTIAFIGMVLSLGIHTIDAGHIGVIRSFGAVTGNTIGPGLQWVPPFVNSVTDVDTRVRSVRIEGYAAASKEQQDLFLNLTLNYHVDQAAAPQIVQTIGEDFEAKIVMPRLLDIPKSITDDYPTAIVLNSRDEIRTRAIALLSESLSKYGFVVDNIALENFGYSPEYNASIEQKQIAQQQVETERQKTEQQKQIAQQKIEAAKGEAQAQIERARGESEANRLVSASLTQQILINRYIEKLAPGIQSILVPSENGFILDLGSLLKPTE